MHEINMFTFQAPTCQMMIASIKYNMGLKQEKRMVLCFIDKFAVSNGIMTH
jgi:hypothetical protein